MATFVTVARTDELASGQGKLVEVHHKRLALFNIEGRYFAIDDVCPHRGGPLSEGELEGGAVVCPWHGAMFDLATGKELFVLLSLNGGKDWLVVTPDGYFDGSEGGIKLMAWRETGTFNVIADDATRQKYHRPGLLTTLVKGEKLKE